MVLNKLSHSPAVHELWANTFLQEPIEISERLLVVPLKELGRDREAVRLAEFVNLVGGKVLDEHFQ